MSGRTLLKSNKMTCTFHMPAGLKSKFVGDNEVAQGLPPGCPVGGYLVDEYPACPSNWMRSAGKKTSYFVPVIEGRGMWLDFNGNWANDFDVAVVISIQGINPITGMPCKDAQLEQYIDKCPKHNKDFGPERFCKECNFKWPKQNYLCTTGQAMRYFWLDGFRSADGVVRQYLLTQEKIRGVAANKIGDDRVFAIGVSFFLSKNKKPKQEVLTRDVHHYYKDSWSQPNYLIGCDLGYKSVVGDSSDKTFTNGDYGKIGDVSNLNISGYAKGGYATCSAFNCSSSESVAFDSNEIKSSAPTAALNMKLGNATKARKSMTANYQQIATSSIGSVLRSAEAFPQVEARQKTLRSGDRVSEVSVKSMEIGAGAKIEQDIEDDPNGLDFWRDESEAVIYINYCTKEELTAIIEQGKVDIEGDKEGFLQDIPSGN